MKIPLYEENAVSGHPGQARAVTDPQRGYPIGSGGIHRKEWIEHNNWILQLSQKISEKI
jgi:hypothetical protein